MPTSSSARCEVVAVTLYDIVLWIHVTAVVVAFGALFAYPIFLAVNARAPIGQRAGLHRAQIAFSKRVTGPVIGVILLAGIYLATDAELWDQAWVGHLAPAAVRDRRARRDRAAQGRGGARGDRRRGRRGRPTRARSPACAGGR